MNLDDIKSSWNKETAENIQLPKSVSALGKAKHPVDKLKRNMRFELALQLATLIILPFYLRSRFSNNMQELLMGVYAVFVLICIYYLYNFYLFYKKNVAYSIASKDSLYDLYYGLRLNMERYKSLGFLLIPFVMIMVGLGSIENPENASMGGVELLANLKNFLITMVLVTAIYIGVVIFWVDVLYGKYARQLKDVLEELIEDDSLKPNNEIEQIK